MHSFNKAANTQALEYLKWRSLGILKDFLTLPFIIFSISFDFSFVKLHSPSGFTGSYLSNCNICRLKICKKFHGLPRSE